MVELSPIIAIGLSYNEGGNLYENIKGGKEWGSAMDMKDMIFIHVANILYARIVTEQKKPASIILRKC